MNDIKKDGDDKEYSDELNRTGNGSKNGGEVDAQGFWDISLGYPPWVTIWRRKW